MSANGTTLLEVTEVEAEVKMHISDEFLVAITKAIQRTKNTSSSDLAILQTSSLARDRDLAEAIIYWRDNA
jgi:hypothetical protein